MFGLVHKYKIGLLSSAAQAVAGLPAGAVGVWYMDQYQATPTPYVPNAASKIAVSQNLMRAPRRLFSSMYYSGNGGPVAVDGVGPGPDGSAGSASSLVATGSFNFEPNGGITLAAGVYTLAVSAKRNTTTDQQFGLQYYGVASSPTMTATSAWQRFSWTTTLGAGGVLPCIAWAAAMNIQICDFTLYAGAVDLGEPALAAHLYLGLNSSEVPAYSGASLDFSSGPKVGLIQMLQSETMPAVTAISFAKKIGSGNSFAPFLSKLQSYTEFTALVNQNGWPDFFYGGQNVDGNAFSTPSGWHMITSIYNGTNIQVWVDDIKVIDLPRSPSAVNLADLVVGILNGGGNQFATDYSYAALALYDRALSAKEVRQAYNVLSARMTKNSNPPALVSKFVVAEGDSITAAVYFNSHVKVYGAANSSTVTTVDYASSGAVIGTLAPRAGTIDSLIRPHIGRKNILTVLIGHNDLNNVANLSQFLIDFAAYCDARRAAGYTVGIGTILTSDPVGFNAARATANTTLRSWVGVHCDFIIDFDTTVMGVDGNASDTSLFVDGTHPTQAGQNILAAKYTTVVNAI